MVSTGWPLITVSEKKRQYTQLFDEDFYGRICREYETPINHGVVKYFTFYDSLSENTLLFTTPCYKHSVSILTMVFVMM